MTQPVAASLPIVDENHSGECETDNLSVEPTATSGTEVGSYFVSNYPPFSLWNRGHLPELQAALASPPDESRPLGLYLHIPFCRKRCRFCYFRVYTNQNARAIEQYVEALASEIQLLSQQPAVQGRSLKFVYFGGGTPSYLSSKQLRFLRDRLEESVSWTTADEVTFECEPGTLNLEKLETLKDIGVTRLSLGVENFDDKILEENGRAHLSPEIYKAYDWIQKVGFPQVNIDLIAGMIGETDENWSRCVQEAARLSPNNITIYQMELPFNTLISKEMKEHGTASPIASWDTKRRWVSEAMDTLAGSGYQTSSGNELVKNRQTDQFVYRDNVWRGCDLLAAGVSSFGHLQGVHYQNLDQLTEYLSEVEAGRLPINRALRPTPHQLLIREFILLLKEGGVLFGPLEQKYGVRILDEFGMALANQAAKGYLEILPDSYLPSEVRLTRKGLLQVDSLLAEYFEPEHRQVRYT